MASPSVAEPDRYRGGHAVTSWPPASGARSGRAWSLVQVSALAASRCGTGWSGSGGQAPVPALDGDRVGPRLGGELAGEVDVPGLQVLGQGEGDQQRRAAGSDGQQRRPVLIAEEGHPRAGVDRQRQRGNAAGGHQAASLCSGAGRGIGRDGARTPVALSEYAWRAAHLPLPWHRPLSTYGMAVMPSNSIAMNGDPGTGGGSTGWYSDGHLDLDRPLPRLRVGVDHLDHPQRQPAVLVGLLDHPVTAGPVEVPHLLEPTGRVRAGGEHRPELHRERT